MQAFYYMHDVPTREFLMAVLERGPFSLSLGLPVGEVLKVPRSGRVEVVVKASFKEGVTPDVIKFTTDGSEWTKMRAFRPD